MQGSDRVVSLLFRSRAIGGKVVTTDQSLGGLLHLLAIEFWSNPPASPFSEQGTTGRVPDSIQVALADGVEAGVPIGDRLDAFDDLDIPGAHTLERVLELVYIDLRGETDSHQMAQCMNTGIGATRSFDLDWSPNDDPSGLGEFPLNGAKSIIVLPTMEISTVISNDQSVSVRQVHPFFALHNSAICTVLSAAPLST